MTEQHYNNGVHVALVTKPLCYAMLRPLHQHHTPLAPTPTEITARLLRHSYALANIRTISISKVDKNRSLTHNLETQ